MPEESRLAGTACEICGQSNPGTLETHHVVPRRFGGSDHPGNLVALCGSCHNAVERIYDDDFYRRLHARERELDTEVDVEELGHETAPHQSRDREIDPRVRHVEPESVTPAELTTAFGVDAGLLKAAGYTPTEDGAAQPLEILHCGYCPTFFLPWEHADCAKHLQIRHHIHDPYEENDPNEGRLLGGDRQ